MAYPEPEVDATDPLQRIVSDATDAVVATVSRSSSAVFAGVTLRCETGGLLGHRGTRDPAKLADDGIRAQGGVCRWGNGGGALV